MIETIKLEHHFIKDFPEKGKALAIYEGEDKYALAWGSKYPYAEEELPEQDIEDESGGVKWYESEHDAVETIENLMKNYPLETRKYYDFNHDMWGDFFDILNGALEFAENNEAYEGGWPVALITYDGIYEDMKQYLTEHHPEWDVAKEGENFYDGERWVEVNTNIVLYKKP